MVKTLEKKASYCIFCGSQKKSVIGSITGQEIILDCECEKKFIMLSETIAGLHRAKKDAHDAFYIKETINSIDIIHDSIVRMKNMSVPITKMLREENKNFTFPKYFKEYF